MHYVGFIYQWTNKINNMKYLGSHKGKIDDGYIGSGKRFLNALRKYGIDNFEREILAYVYVESNILVEEQNYLDKFNCAKNKLYYNISPTAGGGDCGNGSKISKTKKKRKHIAHNKGKSMSPSQKEKLSDVWLIKTPLGESIEISNMNEFCLQNNLNSSAMSAVARGTRRHYKGYWCVKLTNNRDVVYQPKEWQSKGHAKKANFGKKNGMSKKVKVNNVVYDTLNEASQQTGLSLYILRKRGEFL